MPINVQSQSGETQVIVTPQPAHQIEIRRVGVQGAKGDKGDAATITVGSTTTVAPGTPASVTNTGTSGAAILNFEIPQGQKGDKGDKGDGGQVDSIGEGTGIEVDDTDPVNPVVGLSSAAQSSLSKADTAVQPDDLATVATSGSYDDLTDKPFLFSGDYDDLSNKPTLGTAAAADVGDFATATQGSKADTAVQPNDLAAIATSGSFNDLDDVPSTFPVDKADSAAIRGRTADKVLTADNISGAKGEVALAYASTRSLDWKDGWFRTCTLTGNMTLSNPTSVEVGDTIMLRLIGNDATERSIAFGSNYKGPLPEDTVTSTTGLLVSLYAASSTEIHVTWKAFEL